MLSAKVRIIQRTGFDNALLRNAHILPSREKRLCCFEDRFGRFVPTSKPVPGLAALGKTGQRQKQRKRLTMAPNRRA
jgi:hypothetical protein